MKYKGFFISKIKLVFLSLFTTFYFMASAYADPGFPAAGGYWNTNLGMINILELENPSTTRQQYTIAGYDSKGTKFIEKIYSLAAKTQRDIILNDTFLRGRENQHGAIAINSNSYDNISARFTYYRWNATNTAVEFSYTVPGEAHAIVRENTSFVPFNSTQPSLDPNDESAPVDQWLTIANLASSTAKFTINTYNNSGEKIASKNVYLKSYEQRDILAGDTRSNVADNQRTLTGLHEIVPGDSATYYTAQLIRYGHKAGTSNEYAFAVPIQSMRYIPYALVTVSRGANADNYVELSNVTSSDMTYRTVIIGYNGITKFNKSIRLKAHQQIHINAGAYLEEGETGVLISGNYQRDFSQAGIASAIATSVSYYRNSNGSIKTATASPSVLYDNELYSSGYNLYLDSENWLRLYNPSEDKQTITISMRDKNGTLATKEIKLSPLKGIEYPLHDFSRFNTAPDSIGALFVEGKVVGEMVRIGGATNPGNIDFVSSAPIGRIGYYLK